MLQSSGVPDTLRVRELLTAFRGYPAPLPVASVVEAAGCTGWRTGCSGPCPGAAAAGAVRDRIVWGPQLVFVDEPTTGLDAEVRRTLWATLRNLAATGRGVVLTTTWRRPTRWPTASCCCTRPGDRRGHPVADQVPRAGRRITAESSIEAAQASGWAGVHHAQRDGTRLELLVSEAEPVLRELLHRDQSVTGVTVTEPTLEDAFLTLTDRTKEAA